MSGILLFFIYRRNASEGLWAMDRLDNTEMIPSGLGLVHRDNALIRASWAVLFAGFGVLQFGADSLATVLLWVPLLSLFIWSIQYFALQLSVAKLMCPAKLSIQSLSVGPLVIKRNPLKIRFRLRVPIEFFAGKITPRFPEEQPGDDVTRAMVDRIFAPSVVFLVTSSSLAVMAWYLAAPKLVLAAIGCLMFSACRFLVTCLTTRNAPNDELEPAQLRSRASYRVMYNLQSGRVSHVTGEDIRDLTSLFDGAPAEMMAQILAYCVRSAQGEAFLAANHIRRAARVADLVRRNPQPLLPDTVSWVYQEAAFVAAAYAGDVEYARRAMAIGSESYLDPTAYHKAMAAIWIRQANRLEAARSLERAERELRFWDEPGQPGHHELHLADLKAVFIQNDLKPLSKEGIGSEFFFQANRPEFFQSRKSLFFMVLHYVCTVLVVPMFVLAAFAVQAGTDDLSVPGMLVVLTLLSFIDESRKQARARVSIRTIELSGEGLLYHQFGNRCWILWERFEGIGRAGRFRSKPALFVSNEAGENASRTRTKLRYVPIVGYRRGWPNGTVEEALRRFAPHILESDAAEEVRTRAA